MCAACVLFWRFWTRLACRELDPRTQSLETCHPSDLQTTDVAIIGGGVIGCSIAYHLARLGVTHGVVFERKHVASGATGLCPGGIRQQFERDAECRLARRSMCFFEQVNELLQPEFAFFLERSGYLFLAESEALLSRFATTWPCKIS